MASASVNTNTSFRFYNFKYYKHMLNILKWKQRVFGANFTAVVLTTPDINPQAYNTENCAQEIMHTWCATLFSRLPQKIHCVSNKFPPLNSLQLCQILTNFHNFCTTAKRMKFATKNPYDNTHFALGMLLHLLCFPAVQKFWKLVKIWQSYREFKGGNFFETQCSSTQPYTF